MSKLVKTMYKAARKANDVEKITSGSPSRIAKRAVNKILGRKLLSKLFWR